MSFFSSKILLNKVQSFGKIFLVLILSTLLFSPASVLASDYFYNNDFYEVSSNYGYLLEGYTSALKLEFDNTLQSIQKLPTVSYENGQRTLTALDSRLEQLKKDADSRANLFAQRGQQAQTEYENNLNYINANITNIGNRQLNRLQEKNQMQSGIVLLNNYCSKFFDRLSQRLKSAQRIDKKLGDYASQFKSFSNPNVLPEIASLEESLKKVIDFKFIDANSSSGDSELLNYIKGNFHYLGIYSPPNVQNFVEYGLVYTDPDLLTGINGLFQNLLADRSQPTSFVQTCKDLALDGDTLYADCKTPQQTFKRTSLLLKGIENIDGQLKVSSSWNPASFYWSCENISLRGSVIFARCQTRAQRYTPTRLELTGIVNVGGELQYK